MKPSHRTIRAIRKYFASIPSPISGPEQLIVIGDRIFTDVVLGNRLGAYSVLVSRDWMPTMKSRASGAVERAAVKFARRLLRTPQLTAESSEFIKEAQEKKDRVKMCYSGSTWTWAGRALRFGPNSGEHR